MSAYLQKGASTRDVTWLICRCFFRQRYANAKTSEINDEGNFTVYRALRALLEYCWPPEEGSHRLVVFLAAIILDLCDMRTSLLVHKV